MVLDRTRAVSHFLRLSSRAMHGRFTVRPARPSDHAEFTRFFRELGHDDPIPDGARWEREMMPHTIFLEDASVCVGYAFVEEFGERAYVRHVVVDPACRNRGVGRALMHALATRLRERGSTQWELNVKRDNDAAIHLYSAFGMREQYSTIVLQLDWNDAARLSAPDATARAVEVETRDDAEVERRFGLPAGQVARLRASAGHVLIRLVTSAGETCGFARFDPEFPGAFPFRVSSPAQARTLLDALRPYSHGEHAWIQLVIEDDAETAHVLRAAGARLRFEILHMQGPIPRA